MHLSLKQLARKYSMSRYVEEAQTRSQTTNVSPADLMATLVQFSADTIADAISRTIR